VSAGGPPSKLRLLNDQAALAFILQAGAVSRAELGRLTGLSKPGVAELLSRLESAGLVEKAGTVSGGPGPRAQTWRLRSGVGHCLAINVTPDGWALRALDLDGSRVAAAEGAWQGGPLVEELAAAAASVATPTRFPSGRLMGAAIGVPGAVDPRTGIVRGAPGLAAATGYDLANALTQRLGAAVHVENDVNLMALAALDGGLAKEAQSFVFVWIDQGLGAAVVRNGELIRGFTGGAGEIDYLRLPDPALPLGPGAKLGDVLSPQALAALAHDGAAQERDLMDALTAPVPSGLASELVRRVGQGLVAIVAVLDPELILLGGVFGTAIAQALASPIREELARLFETDLSFVPMVRAHDVKPDAALIGAERVALMAARGTAFRSGSLVPPLAPDPAIAHTRDDRP
jgi:predicted NBD/HSP70 family sugar kinase